MLQSFRYWLYFSPRLFFSLIFSSLALDVPILFAPTRTPMVDFIPNYSFSLNLYKIKAFINFHGRSRVI